ncbi:hypothetical protein GCM10007100_01110 [Roseibacillus persicicus]|uniref:Uncharacterized protein n=1 Tax=Roseibacillus persicicus TaxID=454148 RepID=A0A918WFW7_9BACT|nr:hypothetical protein GCM10007100_01110 [Roseibacillus persicicus]
MTGSCPVVSYLPAKTSTTNLIPTLLAAPNMQPSSRLLIAATILAVIFNAAIIFDVLRNSNTGLYDEGQFVEDIGAFCFLSGSLALFGSAFFLSGLEKFIRSGLGAMNLMFFLREVDVHEINVPFPIKEISSNDLKDGLFVVLFLVLGTLFLVKYRHNWKQALGYFQNRIGVLFAVGIGIFATAGLLEQLHFSFAEELLEANGAYCFFLAALLTILIPPTDADSLEAPR